MTGLLVTVILSHVGTAIIVGVVALGLVIRSTLGVRS